MPDLLVRDNTLGEIARSLAGCLDQARFATALFQPLDDICDAMSVAGAAAGTTATQSWALTGLAIGVEAAALATTRAAQEYGAADAQLALRTHSASRAE